MGLPAPGAQIEALAMNAIQKFFEGLRNEGRTKSGIKIHVTGNGVAHVDLVELARSAEVQKLLDDAPNIMRASRRHLSEVKTT